MSSPRAEWSERPDAFASRYAWDKRFVERYEVLTGLIDANSAASKRVIDVGCGSGVFSFYAAERNATVIGIDANPEMVAICRESQAERGQRNASFAQAQVETAHTLGLEPADLLLCSSVLEYLEDLDACLAVLSSLLRERGILIASLPNRSSVFRTAHAISYAVTGWPAYYGQVRHVLTVEEARETLEAHGLEPLQTEYYAATPLLSRLLRPIGLARYADNLFAIVARKG